MHEKDIAIVFDCGATNVRVVAIDIYGIIHASHTLPNETDEDPYYPEGKIWNLEKLWLKLCTAAITVTSKIDTNRIIGITVTTFGVDGTFVNKKGEILYPVISWQCQRTASVMDNIEKYISLKKLYKITGVYPYAFNTINKMIWFKENLSDIFDKAEMFLFIPSLIIHKLSGAMQNDATMMGTSMMADIGKRSFSTEISSILGIRNDIYGNIGEPGDKAGDITVEASNLTGIPAGIPVFLTGHDTQFAIFGSGSRLNQPVLSSGTWEILMSRSSTYTTSEKEFTSILTTELDPVPGIYNIGQNWLGSGVVEWFSKNFYSELKGDLLYETMIKEAEQEIPGSHGLMVDPAFYNDGSSNNKGMITGLTLNTSRSQLYRAFLESLAYRLRDGLHALEKAGNFKAEKIIIAGGGSKNRLWNQLRADVCNIPVELIDHKETTVLGAAMFVFFGAGIFKSPMAARQKVSYNPQVVSPSGNNMIYNQLYKNYIKLKKTMIYNYA